MTDKGLRHRAVSGMKWSMAGRLLKSGLGIVTLAVVSRYLSPAEFGTVALVMFITGFAQLFIDAGLRIALVQRETITELQKNTVFWGSLANALVLAGLVVVLAPQIAAAFDAEAVTPLVRWIAPIFPLAALQGVSLTLLERRFDFARLAISDFSSAVAGALTAMALVVAGHGMAGLIAQQLVQALAGTLILTAMARWRPSLRFSWTEYRSLASYGGYVLLSGIVNFLNVNLSRPIVAGVISAPVLGHYTMAQQVVASPFRIIVSMARKVMFPILSSVQSDRQRVGTAYLTVQFAIMAVMAPASLGVAAVTYPLTGLLLGPTWGPTAPLIQLVAIQILLSPIQETNQTVLASLGHARFQFWWGLIAGGISTGGMWVAAHWGIEAAVLSRSVLMIVTIPALSTYTMRQMDLRGWALAGALQGPMLAALVMFGAVFGLLEHLTLPDLAELAIGIPLGAALYVPLLFLLAPARTRDLRDTLLRRKRRAPAPGVASSA
ncbi:lipopolysaccharide biosynthesis protein [Frigidibacter sp. MR17.14]|uniref:lipopolysaccharide biosynthesis protein n=1 Tax=Frigidibacter sp. MR17.14 TaxID=3126509 RepID=UPI003012E74E